MHQVEFGDRVFCIIIQFLVIDGWVDIETFYLGSKNAFKTVLDIYLTYLCIYEHDSIFIKKFRDN